MTIELITGTPGAGKTAFTVGRRLAEESGRQVAVDREGGGVDLVERRIVVCGINGLALPHDRLPHTLTGERVNAAEIATWNECDADGEPLFKRLPGEHEHNVPASLFNWWLWCRPGDLIVCDEVQFIIPRGTLGKVPPHYIKSLEIHRHYGVDFIFITQSPTLLDNTIRNLVGLHRHVRSVMGTSLCMMYEWDHASNTERITNAAKRFFRRRSAWFKLYRSTVAVVKPPSSGKAGALAIPILLLVSAGAAWAVSQRFTNPKSATSSASVAALASPAAPGGAAAPRTNPPGWADVPKLTGCYTVGSICRCLGVDGRPVQITAPMCRVSASSFDGLVKWEKRDPYVPASPASAPPPSASPVPKILPAI